MTACDWPITYTGCGAPDADPNVPCAPLDTMTPEERAAWEQMAADLLWRWSGGVFGVCDVIVRPCRDDCADAPGPSTFWGFGPYTRGSMALRTNCNYCGRTNCRCTYEGSTTVVLLGPVVEVSEVVIEGVPVPSTAYRVDYGRYLVRTDGQVWPTCQDLNAAPGQPGTWTVAYKRGIPVPIGGSVAAGVLACEFAKAACNDASCQLPKRVQSVTRQGITVALLDNFEDIQDGRTGIWLVDSWVASVSAPRPSVSVRSVDIPHQPGVGQPWPV